MDVFNSNCIIAIFIAWLMWKLMVEDGHISIFHIKKDIICHFDHLFQLVNFFLHQSVSCWRIPPHRNMQFNPPGRNLIYAKNLQKKRNKTTKKLRMGKKLSPSQLHLSGIKLCNSHLWFAVFGWGTKRTPNGFLWN